MINKKNKKNIKINLKEKNNFVKTLRLKNIKHNISKVYFFVLCAAAKGLFCKIYIYFLQPSISLPPQKKRPNSVCVQLTPQPFFVTHDTVMWHVTCDMWHMTCDTWHTGSGEHCLKTSGLTV